MVTYGKHLTEMFLNQSLYQLNNIVIRVFLKKRYKINLRQRMSSPQWVDLIFPSFLFPSCIPYYFFRYLFDIEIQVSNTVTFKIIRGRWGKTGTLRKIGISFLVIIHYIYMKSS